MQPSRIRRSAFRLTLAASLITSIWLVACSDSDPGQLEVAVSSGYPIKGATITLRGATGASLELTDTTNSGSVVFARRRVIDTLGAGPYLIRSTGGTANGVAADEYYSIASAPDGRANVTPITHLIAVEATGATNTAGLKTLFASGYDSAKAQAITTTKLNTAKTNVASVLKLVNPQIDIAPYDPLTKTFAFGDSVDSQLDLLKLALKSGKQSIDSVQALVTKKSGGADPIADAEAFKPIKRVIVFGDSLSDGGTYTAWASGAASGANRFIDPNPLAALKAASVWGGKFTTNPGPVWIERLAAGYGYEIKPAMLMGGGAQSANLSAICPTCTNYAQGGSRVKLQPGIGNVGTTANPANPEVKPQATVLYPGNAAGARVPSDAVLAGLAQANYDRNNAFLGASSLPVSEQIDIHLASSYVSAGKFLQGDLVLVLAGANDVFTQAGLAGAGVITAQAAGAAVQTAATELVGQAVRLRNAGASQLAIIGLPDMGNTPAGVAQGKDGAAALTQLSTKVFNAVIGAGLKQAGIAYLDPAEFFTSLMTNPSKYGIKTTIDATSSATAIASTACGPNAIAAAAKVDNPNSPSSLYCSVPNTTVSNQGTLRAASADSSYVFADGVHPSTQSHKALADYLSITLPRLVADSLASAAK